MLDLEKALRTLCAADPQYATLLAQWTFDKQLVGRALNAVPLVFPHYSLHDASHSDTIIRQMARVLGPRRIERLGPTDLWLLLEAAYHHDLGMVVADDTARGWWNDENFYAFLDRLKNHADDDIRGAAELLDTRRAPYPPGKTSPFDVRRALTLVIAEYARARHAEQARKYIEVPALIDSQSPRTDLVPRRFWRLLGRICESHGKSFAETMMLPARESGFGADEAHPRFIACMLRLGDLLDLDDGRFCPVLARTFGGLPPSSKTHEKKHASIEEFLVNDSEIRVVAECDDPDVFDVTEQWFAWLRQEISDQSTRWAAISPEVNFGAVPSAARIEVRAKGYHTTPDGGRPRFEVDKEAMLDFVKGAGLYGDETACIAELLQNAVDATLLRVWAANRKKWRRLAEQKDNGALDKLRERLKRYPIDVHVQKSKGVGERNHWTVVIRDQGAGISKEDIPFLQRVGSSRKNPRRQHLMEGMPEWMKPSGYFGIGLQSVFLFTNKVLLRSRAHDSLETIEIELTQRPGSREPQILVKSIEGKKALAQPGTRVSFQLTDAKVPKRFHWNNAHEETDRVFRDYDPLLHDELPLLPSKVRDATRIFAKTALVHVRLDGLAARADVAQEGPKERFFDAEQGVELMLRAGEWMRFNFLYRGRPSESSFGHWFFGGSADWHRGNAAGVLTINREKVRGDASEMVDERLMRALLNVLPRYYDAVRNDPARQEERRYVALAARVLKSVRDEGNLPPDESWMELVYNRSEYTFGIIERTPRIVLIEDPTWQAAAHGHRQDELTLSEDREVLTMSGSNVRDWMWEFLRNRHVTLQRVQLVELASPLPQAIRHTVKTWRREWLALRDVVDSDIVADDDVLKAVLEQAASEYQGRSRRTIPCSRRFRAMAYSPTAAQDLGWMAPIYGRLTPRAIFPFRIESDKNISLAGIEQLIKWTYEHRLDKGTTEPEIARAVLDLVRTADDWLRAGWEGRIDYSIRDLERKLSKVYGAEVLALKPSGGAASRADAAPPGAVADTTDTDADP